MNNQQSHWNKLHTEGKADHYSVDPTNFAKEVQNIIPIKSKILELGCGTGNDSNYFAQCGHSILATDFSEVAIEKDKRHYSSNNLVFQVLDMSKPMKFSNNEFDVIYARLSLHYFTDEVTKKIFQEIHRVLKPNGFLCFLCKSTTDPLYGKGSLIEKDMFDNNGHIRHFFSENYVKDCLEGLFHINKLETGEEKFYGNLSSYIKVIAKTTKNL